MRNRGGTPHMKESTARALSAEIISKMTACSVGAFEPCRPSHHNSLQYERSRARTTLLTSGRSPGTSAANEFPAPPENNAPSSKIMAHRTRRLIVAATLAAAAQNAHVQNGNVAAGHAFAREACNPCHVIETEQRVPRLITIGPAFRDIANTPGVTATALRAFLTSSHPKMPNLILEPEETVNIIAYILSLRDR
jgi:cytochrome c551/c552